MTGIAKIGIDAQALIFYLLNFGVILFIVSKFIYRPLVKFLDERRQTIHQNLSESEILRKKFEQEIAKRETEHQEELKRIRSESMKTKRAAEAQAKALILEAETERERIISEARNQSQTIKARAEAEIEEELINRTVKLINLALKQGKSSDATAASIRSAWQEQKNK